MLDAIEQQPQLAHIFVDNTAFPTCCILLYGHGLWLGGEVTDTLMQEACGIIHIKPNLGCINVYYNTPMQEKMIRRTFPQIYPEIHSLLCRAHGTPLFPPPASSRVTLIDHAFFQSSIANLEMIRQEVISTATYANMDQFLHDGIGYCFIANQTVRGFCTSEIQSASSVAIGIEVDPAFTRQGIAKEMTHAFLSDAANRQLTVYWDCMKDNTASYQTALSCGFTPVTDYPALFVPLS